jgi:hypothetical protein
VVFGVALMTVAGVASFALVLDESALIPHLEDVD